MENKEKLFLINWETNWADEMDISGFVVSDGKTLDLWKKILMRKDSFTIVLGTNEENYYDSGQELLDECSIKEITKEEAEILVKILSPDEEDDDFDEEDDDFDEEEDEEGTWIEYGSTEFWYQILWDEDDDLDT